MPYKNAERQKEYLREYARQQREKKKQEHEKVGKDPLDLNDLGEKGNELKPVPLSWEEWYSENPDGSKTDWVHYKLNFSTQQQEELWKAEPKKPANQSSTPTPSFQNMLNNSGENKAGMQSCCSVCGSQLDRYGNCPNRCTLSDFF